MDSIELLKQLFSATCLTLGVDRDLESVEYEGSQDMTINGKEYNDLMDTLECVNLFLTGLVYTHSKYSVDEIADCIRRLLNNIKRHDDTCTAVRFSDSGYVREEHNVEDCSCGGNGKLIDRATSIIKDLLGP